MPERFDVVVAGGGYVGLSLALALKSADPGLAVAVVEPKPREAIRRDGRASAIAAAARAMLERLGVWSRIAAEAQPILDMVVTDSRVSDAVRPVFLTFGGRLEDGEPFAHMVPNAAMVGALLDAAEAAGVVLFAPDSVADFTLKTSAAELRLASGTRLDAALLVAADGVRSRLRDLAGIRTVNWDYGQSGIVTTIEHERPHEGRAEEHFLPSGPFAILPLPDDAAGRHRSSLVWSERRDEADRLVRGDDFTFSVELERRFGRHLGALRQAGPRHAYPLGLTLARAWVKPRFALCGDAAHGIHPIAGQGLNIGFRDVAALAEVVVEARRLGQDPGALDVLSRYERWRRFDAFEMGVVTDVLNRLFSNDLGPLRVVRDIGLGLVDRLPALKRRFIREAAGIGGDMPRLLRGEPI
ncbi:ubiquinone biosynthesis hydroxylase [Prosthecomicrobium sp. N25]|uniref:ubiquinone biosynthesis hydroxylase n=1 Tax=Prosthecomicrobium sp. N25 TaxID=3129254 RepID=UPI003076E2A7